MGKNQPHTDRERAVFLAMDYYYSRETGEWPDPMLIAGFIAGRETYSLRAYNLTYLMEAAGFGVWRAGRKIARIEGENARYQRPGRILRMQESKCIDKYVEEYLASGRRSKRVSFS